MLLLGVNAGMYRFILIPLSLAGWNNDKVMKNL